MERASFDNGPVLMGPAAKGIIFVLSFIFNPGLLQADDVRIPVDQISESPGRYFIVSVGVNDYKDPFWPALKWPASDAQKMSERLGSNTNHQIIRYSLLNAAATINAVTATLQEVAARVTERDVVLLYLSGHGTLSPSFTGELERVVVLHDTREEELYTTGLRHSTLNDWLESLKANRKMMVLATCHSGEGKSRLPEKVHSLLGTAKGALIPLREASHGALVLAAAAQGESAYENDELQGDIYTHFFLEALDVYDRNKDGVVSALEAHDYARDRTWEFTKGNQRPTLYAKLVGDADIPLIGVKTSEGLPVLTAYDKRLSGFYMQVDEGVKGRLPTAFPLDPGGSKVVLYTPETLQQVRSYKVRANPGRELTLQEVMNHRPLNVGFAARRFRWSDTAWANVSGDSNSTAYETQLGYHFDPFGMGVIFSYTQDKRAILQPAIRSDVALQSQYIYAEYRTGYRSVQLNARYEMGYETMNLELTDRFTGESLSYEDNSYSYGLALLLAYNVVSDVFITAGIGHRKANWDFGAIGDISGERTWLSLGMDYHFGWDARTMW